MVLAVIVLFLQQLLQLTVEEEERDKLMALLAVALVVVLHGKTLLQPQVRVLLTKDLLEVMLKTLAALVMEVVEVEEQQQLVVMEMEKTVGTVGTV